MSIPKLDAESPHEYIVRNYEIYKNDVQALTFALMEQYNGIPENELPEDPTRRLMVDSSNGFTHWFSIATCGINYCKVKLNLQ